ncbi:MAG: efflux RND transporter periplasmic adaptor subunit [Planctomycetota bacterium]
MLWAGLPAAGQQQATPVRAVAIERRTVQDKTRLNGSLRAVQQSAVAAQEAGRVEGVSVDEGVSVTAGQVIARLDRRRLEAEKAQAEAERAAAASMVDAAQADRDLALSEFDRMQAAFESRASSADELQEAKFALAAAEARVATAEREVQRVDQTLALLGVRLDDTEIVAPFDGMIVARHVDAGEWLNAGDPVVTLLSTGPIEVWLDVPERFSRFDPTNAPLQIEVGGLVSVATTDVRRVPQVDPRARTFRLIATIDDGGQLTPGMSANAFVPTGQERQALCVPPDAIVRDVGGSFVYRATQVEGGRIAEMVPVRVLFDDDGMLAIESAVLADGDMVVVEGNERLMPSTPVVIESVSEGGEPSE